VNTPRPVTLTIASVLLLLVSLFNLTTPFAPVGPPPPISYFIVGLGVFGILAVSGLWTMKSWGMLLAIILAVLAFVNSILGLINAPLFGKVVSALALVLYAVALILVMLPASRKAVAAARG
jgi:hypothetical protein